MAWDNWRLSVGASSIISLLASQPVLAAPVPITDVELYDTDKGIEIVLKIPQQASLIPKTSVEDKTFIVTIPNTQLQLTGRKSFVTKNPTAEIAEIFISQVDPNTVEIEVTGVKNLPKVNIRQKGQEFSVDIISETPTETPTPTPTPQPTETPTPSPTLTPQPTETPQPPESSTKPEEPEEPEEPIELSVVGEQLRPTYRVPNSSIGTRTDTPIINVPQAIQVIPQEIIKDQGTRSIGEVFKNTSSANTGRSSSQAPALNPVIRGFESTNILRNGIRDETLRFNSEISNVERVELLKGPASVLFGRGDLGGVVNLVTKKPLDEPFYSVEYQVGQFGLHRPSIDISGPLGKDGVAYRLNSAYQSAESFKKFENNNSFFISPSVRLIGTKDTTLIADIEYLKYQSFNTAPDLPASGTVIDNPRGKVPLNANLGEPSLSQSEATVTRLGYQLEHRLSPDWTIRNEFSGSSLDIPENTGVIPISNSGTPDGLNRDGRTVRRFLVDNPSSLSSISFNTNLSGKFNTGSIKHELLFGVDVARESSKDKINFTQLAAIDIFNPVYRPQSLGRFSIPFGDTDIRKNTIGLYAQNQISLSKNIIFVLGGRFDFSEQRYEDLLNPDESFERNDSVFSPRVGLVIKPSENLSFYASYSKSFTPVIGRTRILVNEQTGESLIGEPFKPERGTQYEVGVKADLGDRVSATLAFYNLERTNVAAQGLSEPLSQIQIGKQRSRGIELDVAGEIVPGWNLAASYSYTDTEISEDNRTNFNGKQLQNVPKNAFGLWTSYELQSGSLKGLGVGVGVFNQGERQGNLLNTFTLPGYWRTDASIFYRRDNFRAALNFQNLFDKEYFEGARDIVRVVPGAPFTVSGSISFEF
ncbi:MAG: TonB-dependent siderophore receptor [Calothrix sp. CSU_2_0]|nr:TonB-dependent siderophore receptor [Calothrix sp. CSU_2_0]